MFIWNIHDFLDDHPAVFQAINFLLVSGSQQRGAPQATTPSGVEIMRLDHSSPRRRFLG